jgi:nicotinamidase-related amidase
MDEIMDVLLLVDLQIDFLADDGRLPVGKANAERIINVANRMAALFAEQQCPIIVIANQFKRSDTLGNFFRRHAAMEGTEGACVDPRVQVRDACSFSKAKSSAFTNPDLADHLKATLIDRLVICGVYAEGCVRATAFDALRAGLETVVISDGVASKRTATYKWALTHMRKRGVWVMSMDEYLAGLRRP